VKPLSYLIVALGLSVFLCSMPLQALAGECPKRNLPGPDCYTEDQANPLRLSAYVMYPFGWITEWVLTRPFHALVSSSKGAEAVFGHTAHDPYIESIERDEFGTRISDKKAPPVEEKVKAEEPTSERVIVKKVVERKTVIKEVPKIVKVERIVLPDVAFRFDSAKLTELGKGIVYLAAQKLKVKTDSPVKIEGHADIVGTDKYNKGLGLRRAQSVKTELERLGIAPGRLRVSSLGEAKPLINQEADWARAANRRVELRFNSN
jgi:outer membrane protein OmpA-like peptidoglycan-associated protein